MMMEAAGSDTPMTEVEELEIVVENTSYAYRANNNGPELLLIPEYVPYCMMKDVIRIMELGIKVKLTFKEVCSPR